MKKVGVSKIQKQFWILNEINPDSSAYNLYSVFRLSAPLNLKFLKLAVKAVIDRHEPLRTSFEFSDNELFQRIKTPAETNISIDEVDTGQNFDERNIHPDIIYEVNRPFDLSSSPLCRVTLFHFKSRISVLTIVFHHIIVDVRSEGIFAREFCDAFNSLTMQTENQLNVAPFQYSDYISEITPWYSSDQYLKKLEELIIDNPDPNIRIQLPNDIGLADTASGSEVYFKIDSPLTEKVKKFCSNNSINPYRFFLAAYAILLNRLSRQEKIYIGIPLTNRIRLVSKATFGCFVNALPMLVDFSTDKTMMEVMVEVVASLSKLLGKQEIPFTDLVNMKRQESSTTINPYFQTGFAFKPPMQLELDNIIAKPLKVEKKENQAEFDFLLSLFPENEYFVGYITYSKQIFQGETIKRWIAIYQKIIIQFIESPGLRVSEVNILTEEDKKKLTLFNNTAAPVPDLLIHELIEKQANLAPLKIAIVDGMNSLTYKELDYRSNQLANYLIIFGVKFGDTVGICIERSANMVVSILGILKAGACYLPLDPSFPDERIKFMFEESGASVVISQGSLKGKFTEFQNATIVCTDTDNEKLEACSSQKPILSINPQSLAYIMYTSGSTGTPKGVKVHHEAVVNLIESMSQKPGIQSGDILLAVVTLSFDMSVYELFLPLSVGATIVVATAQETTNGQAIINLIDKHNITMLQATPSLWNILLASGWKGKSNLRAFCGGEALTRNMVRQILPKVAEFWNCYGPTETTVYATCIHITDPDAPILIGRPLNNTTIHILDKNNIELPVGVIGEVCIGGHCVTKGYNKRPDLTAEKFVPFGDGRTIYKTGDLGRYLANGNIELFGRIDNQLKIRGFRIEPGEIESLLSRLPGIKEAVVKIHRFDEHDERLVAFLNTDAKFKLDKEKVISALANHLPAYMIPSFFQVSVGFPRLPSGKIDKKALLLELQGSHAPNIEQIKALTPTERIIHHIWSNALKTEDILVTDNFFTIGGNSLLAISVFSKIATAFNLDLGLRVFFDSPRIKDLAEIIDALTQKKSEHKLTRETVDKHKIISGEL